MSYTLQSALESGQEAWIVQIYFSAAFDMVNYQGILYWRFCVVYIDTVSIKSVTAGYGGVNWLMSCQECCKVVFGHIILQPVHFGAFFYSGKLADRLCIWPHFANFCAILKRWVTVPESLSRDPVKVSERCDLWGMKLNASKTKTMIVTRSNTMHPHHRRTIGGTVLKESDDLVILGVTFYSKITFENHLRSVSWATFQRLGILRKSW